MGGPCLSGPEPGQGLLGAEVGANCGGYGKARGCGLAVMGWEVDAVPKRHASRSVVAESVRAPGAAMPPVSAARRAVDSGSRSSPGRLEVRARRGKGLLASDEVRLSRRIRRGACDVRYDPDTYTIHLTPSAALCADTVYAVWRADLSGVPSRPGAEGLPVEPFLVEFRTVGSEPRRPSPALPCGTDGPAALGTQLPHRVGPRLVESSPALGAVNVPTDTEVSLRFDQPLDAATVSDRSIGLRDVEAFRLLVEANMGLVHQAAGHYSRHGYPFDDLVQAGTLGLIRAVERFDPERGNRFSTFSVWWIQQSIQRALGLLSPCVRVPDHVGELLERASRTEEALTHQYGRTPSLAEVAREVGASESSLGRLRFAQSPPVSLDRPIGDENEVSLAEFLPDPVASGPDQAALTALGVHALRAAVDSLPAQQRQVILLRFGLFDQVERTLAEVGALLGLSRERVRQIEVKALQRLRGRMAVTADPSLS